VEYRHLGRTGMSVSSLCLGTMMFGAWGNEDHGECERIVHAALDAGVNMIDTADVYSAGEAERIVGAAISGRRDEVILTTKCHHPMGPDPNERGNSRRWIMRAVEASLDRLGTDWIDLYFVHRPDPDCDIDETLGALSDLVHAGKIRSFGCSAFPAHEIVAAAWDAERRNREAFACEQPEYSILVRTAEADVLPVCQRQGMGAISWSPLAAGWLTGRYREAGQPPAPKRAQLKPTRYDLELPHNPRKLEVVEHLAELAAEAELTLIELALGFVLRHPGVTAPIIGPRRPEQLPGLLSAAEVVLEDAVLDRIDELVPPGTALNTGEPDWRPRALEVPELRRRRGALKQATWSPPELKVAAN
jgi:aryl-alcohol dehydrogenase-like predicted oxidoreductase